MGGIVYFSLNYQTDTVVSYVLTSFSFNLKDCTIMQLSVSVGNEQLEEATKYWYHDIRDY